MATPIELKTDYLVELENRIKGETFLALIHTNADDELCVSSEKTWFGCYNFNDNFEYEKRYRINKVYGRCANMYACKVEIGDRKLLWEREEKELTVEEIEKLLGYKIKIVGGK